MSAVDSINLKVSQLGELGEISAMLTHICVCACVCEFGKIY